MLFDLVDKADREAWETEHLDAVLDGVWGRTCAVLVVDMSGFTRTTAALGIGMGLLLVRQLQRVSAEAVAAHGGRVVKTWADNVFAVFDTVTAAEAAAQRILTSTRPRASAGIGFGRILDLGDDFYGDQVNQASRLGEDEAEAGELLMTPEAEAALAKEETPPPQ